MNTKWPIDGIPDDALPRLLPRPLVYTETGTTVGDPQDMDPTRLGELPAELNYSFFALVTLKDCAPFLGTWPPDICELSAVSTRLLLVPGGPLVLEDGQTTRLRRPRHGEAAFGYGRILSLDVGLTCHITDMVCAPHHVPQTISRAHRAGLRRVVRHAMAHYFLRHDDNTFEMFDKHLKDLVYPRTDSMLAGISAKEGDHGEA